MWKTKPAAICLVCGIWKKKCWSFTFPLLKSFTQITSITAKLNTDCYETFTNIILDYGLLSSKHTCIQTTLSAYFLNFTRTDSLVNVARGNLQYFLRMIKLYSTYYFLMGIITQSAMFKDAYKLYCLFENVISLHFIVCNESK